jgi:hypothetical protein
MAGKLQILVLIPEKTYLEFGRDAIRARVGLAQVLYDLYVL